MKTFDYLPLNTNFIMSLVDSTSIFDIYVNESTDFTKVISKGDTVSIDRFEELLDDENIKFFAIKNDIYDFREGNRKLSEMISKSVAAEKFPTICDYLCRYSERVMDNAFLTMKVDASVYSSAKDIVLSALMQIYEDKSGLLKIYQTASTLPHMVKHSVEVALFSVLISMNSEIESKSVLTNIAIGALVHDAGIGNLTYNPESCEELTPVQRRELLRHPEMAKKQLDRVRNLPSVILDIVMQHHERPNGHGYPNGLRLHEISKSAKIVAIADTFAALRSERVYRQAFTIKESIERMTTDVGKFDTEILKTFFKLLK